MEPFIGEIVLFAGNFAPRGWSFCNGQLLSISVNASLYSILGTTFGGDGIETFGLPDLRGRVPVHPGTGVGLSKRTLGESGGMESIVLTINQMPTHTHVVSATVDVPIFYENSTSESTGVLITPESASKIRSGALDKNARNLTTENFSESTGHSSPHNNMQPYQCINFIIALQGIYPARS